MSHRTCPECGTQFQPTWRGQMRCSRSCAQRRRYRDSRAQTATCEVCGTGYRYTYAGQRTCGRQCGWDLRKREGKVRKPARLACANWHRAFIPVYIRECRQCGGTFCSLAPRRAICSRGCFLERRRANNWGNRQRPPQSTACVDCGTSVKHPRRKCEGCRRVTRRARKNRDKRKRRAAKLNIPSEPYTRAEIAARDQHRCQLCGLKVNMRRAVPHPKAPTIDHVIPLSDGGDDTRANVQLAHFICNSVKGASGTQQLALIG